VPRSSPSRADAALIHALAQRGKQVSPYQLERWRTAGLLPRNQRRGLGRSRGSVSELDPGTLERATILAEHSRQGRSLPGAHVIERFARGLPVAEERVRAAFAAQLDRIAHHLAADAGTDDAGWQARHDAAKRIARNARINSPQDLLDALLNVPEGARLSSSRADERHAVRTYVHTMAGGAETTYEDLLQALAAYGVIPHDALPQLISEQRHDELAGVDDWEQVGRELSIGRFRDVLRDVPIDELQRAVTAVWEAWTSQSFVALMGMGVIVTKQTGTLERIPEPMRQLDAVLMRLQDDPGWQAWGRYQGIDVRSRALRIKTLVVQSLGILQAPDLLDELEAYRDRLAALVRPIGRQLAASQTRQPEPSN